MSEDRTGRLARRIQRGSEGRMLSSRGAIEVATIAGRSGRACEGRGSLTQRSDGRSADDPLPERGSVRVHVARAPAPVTALQLRPATVAERSGRGGGRPGRVRTRGPQRRGVQARGAVLHVALHDHAEPVHRPDAQAGAAQSSLPRRAERRRARRRPDARRSNGRRQGERRARRRLGRDPRASPRGRQTSCRTSNARSSCCARSRTYPSRRSRRSWECRRTP